ncbi:hypothetical protein ACV229_33085 [Burkholderia sp. MR1-5-21]
MNPIDRFSLETHAGPYESWPARSRVIVDGNPSGLAVSGYTLLRQYETRAGYLLVTDYDCPFEEAVTFSLVSKKLDKVLSKRTVGGAYASYWLDDVTWTDERNFTATFVDTEGRWDFTIRDWSLPFVLPTLHMSYVAPRHGARRP